MTQKGKICVIVHLRTLTNLYLNNKNTSNKHSCKDGFVLFALTVKTSNTTSCCLLENVLLFQVKITSFLQTDYVFTPEIK